MTEYRPTRKNAMKNMKATTALRNDMLMVLSMVHPSEVEQTHRRTDSKFESVCIDSTRCYVKVSVTTLQLQSR